MLIARLSFQNVLVCVYSKAQISARAVCESHLRTHQYNTTKLKAEEQLGDQYEAGRDVAGSHLVTLSGGRLPGKYTETPDLNAELLHTAI